MTEQEFKAVSLPHGLKMFYNHSKTEVGFIYNLTPLTFNDSGSPIVRSLEDITKECTQKDYNDGKPFIPIDHIKESQRHLFFREDIKNPLDGLQHSEYMKLLKWHFDLMDKSCSKVFVSDSVDPYKVEPLIMTKEEVICAMKDGKKVTH